MRSNKGVIKVRMLAYLVFFSYTLLGQSGPKLNVTFNHLALSVKDVNRSAEFYTTVLGLAEITNKTKMEGIR